MIEINPNEHTFRLLLHYASQRKLAAGSDDPVAVKSADESAAATLDAITDDGLNALARCAIEALDDRSDPPPSPTVRTWTENLIHAADRLLDQAVHKQGWGYVVGWERVDQLQRARDLLREAIDAEERKG